MQTRTKKTLTIAALGFAATAVAAGTASAADALGSATNLLPGAASTVAGAHSALANGSSGLPGNPTSLVPSGNHLSGNSVAPATGLLGGLPVGGGVLGG